MDLPTFSSLVIAPLRCADGGALHRPGSPSTAAGPSSMSLIMLLIDDFQCLYDNACKHGALFGYLKRLKQGERGLRLTSNSCCSCWRQWPLATRRQQLSLISCNDDGAV